LVVTKQQYPAQIGTDNYVETAIDFHSLTYNTGILSDVEKTQFNDKYTVYNYNRSGLSMIGNSFVMGIIATIIAYALGLPLGMLMARRKDKMADKFGNAYIIFISAVPSLAYIFMLAAFGTALFHLPYKFANAEVPILAYILPTISLSLPSIGSLMKWMRRYMIDQMNSDYVKFARSQGLSEKEIFNIHISRNAMIYLVHGIPASILGCLTGAIITERVYSVPGVGNLLTRAINSHDNGIIVACTVFYTSLSIISLILGDLLLTKYDPRISLSEERGGGR
ncbi:MAG: ABC transporter permease, partial [Erysipelotrichaceae bacterium]|nr:ABC transporter permease [Erysipelotrichaceae bacterium]